MFDPLEAGAKVIAGVGGGHIRRTAELVRIRALEYEALSDERLREKCLRLLSGRSSPAAAKRQPWLTKFINAVLRRRSDPVVVEAIALGIEVFRRNPADLPPGSRLYPQQVEAAVALTERCVIQMDTGEGKTYALLPAALALACRYPHVYVLCANDYLAERDATRTLSFWRFLGLRVGLAIESNRGFEREWSAQVVYTTLRDFMFKRQRDQIAGDEPGYPMTTAAAVLVDEADAVLIDAAFESYAIAAPIEPSSFDWSRVLEIAAKLDPTTDVITDVNPFRASLTVPGETLVRGLLGANGVDETKYLMTRHAVELAYLAARVVKEDVHFVREGTSLFGIDPLTGRIQRDMTPGWLTPLAFINRLPPRPPQLIQDRLWPTSLLAEFPHLAAMSGTVAQDAVEYLFSYMLTTHVIPPRFQRSGTIELDKTFLRAEEAFAELGDGVANAVAGGRPVLVATQSIEEAERFHQHFSRNCADPLFAELLTGKNDYDAAAFFKQAGERGRITIATQLAGRGVDIRLTGEAKTAGGMALLCLGHAPTTRHDRQLMGRVGRQGDPFTIQFINSLQDSFFTRFKGFMSERFLRKLGLQDSDAIEHSWIDRLIRSVQSKYALAEFQQRRHAGEMSSASRESRARFFAWFDACRVVDDDPKECSRYFIDMLLDHFTESTVTPVLRRARELSEANAQSAAAGVCEALSIDEKALGLSRDDLVGLKAEAATGVVRKRLSAQLGRIFEHARDRREKIIASSLPAVNAADSGQSGSARADQDNGGEVSTIASAEPEADAVTRLVRVLYERAPRHIAYAVLRQMWSNHIEELDRLDFQVAQGGYAPINRYRLLRERIIRAQQQMHNQMSGRLLSALLRADEPEKLDQLFFVFEHEAAVEDPHRSAARPTWQPEMAEIGWERFGRPTNYEDIIDRFIGTEGDQLISTHFTGGQLRRLLLDFTKQSPLASLRRPDKILDALRTWFTLAAERGLGRVQRQHQRRALRAFLLYLSERNLIGQLPRLQDHAVATSRRLAANLRGLRVALPLLAIALFAVVFAGLSHVSVGSLGELTGIAALADQLLFGGGLTTGGVAQLIVGSLAAGCIAAAFVQPQVDLPGQMTGFGKPIFWCVLAVVVVLVRLFDPGNSGALLSVIYTCLALIAVFVIGEIMRNWLALLYADTGLSIISLWLAYTSIGVLGFGLAGQAGNTMAFLAVFAGGMCLRYLWHVVGRSEITLLSRRLILDTSQDGEDVRTTAEVRGDVGTMPHALGVLIAWSAIGAVPIQLWAAYRWLALPVAFVIYFAITAILIRQQLQLRVAPQRWRIRLNEMHQVFVEQDWGASLEDALLRVRRWLFRRELLLLLLLSAGFGGTAGVFFEVSPEAESRLALFGLLGAVVGATYSASFATELYRFVFNQGTVMPVTLETSRLRESSEDEGLAERLKRFFEHRAVVALTLFIPVLHTTDMIRDFIEWVGKLWHGH